MNRCETSMRRWMMPWLLCGLLTACHGKAPTPPSIAGAPAALHIVDLRLGKGPAVHAGQTAVVDYTGWLYDAAAPEHQGRQFDSSLGSAPLRFKLGAGRVIKGWDEGVAGMRVGGRRRLVIPPGLAYGARGAEGVIAPNATLVFDIELVDIE